MTLKQLRTVTIAEAKEKLNVSPDWLRRACVAGKVRYFQDPAKPGSRKGGTYHIVESDLVRLVESLLRGTAPAEDHAEQSGALSSSDGLGRPFPSRSDISDLMPPPSERRFS